MKKLLCYMKGYRKECVLSPAFKLLEASFELLVPLVMAAVIDTGIKNGDRPYIIHMCLLMVALGVIGLCCTLVAQYFAAKAAVGFSSRLRQALFARIQKLSYSQLDRAGTSTLITRMTSDINQVQNGVNLTLRLLLRSPFVVFGAMLMAFTIDWKAALVFAVVIPLLFLVVFWIMLWTMPRYKRVQAGLDRVLGVARENLTGVRVIRAFGREEAEIRRFDEENESLTRMQTFVGKVSALMNPLTYILINLATMAVIWVGGLRANTGAVTQGQVVALVNYMAQILVELIKLANLIINIAKALACAGRVEAVLELPVGMELPRQGETGKRPGALAFEDVSLTYGGAGAESLSPISFSAEPGQVVGPSGGGKTTLCNLIPRFYDCTSGRVLVSGTDVREWDPEALRSRVGVVPQKAVLFSGTIRENLLWGKEDASEEELWQALETAQAKDFVEQKKQGLDEPVAQGGRNFSGGQRQRLTIARALARKPDFLILDDSASALDYATDLKLRTAIADLPNSPTVLLVSQRAASVRQADVIVVLDDGEAVGVGTHDELLESCQVYREIYESQFQKEKS